MIASWTLLAGAATGLAAVSRLVGARAARPVAPGRRHVVLGRRGGAPTVERARAAAHRSRLWRAAAARLATAGLSLDPGAAAVRAGGALAAVFLVVDRTGSTLLAAAATGGTLAAGRRWLARQRLRRTERLVAQLPELARALSAAAEAGLALRSALVVAARELGDPLRSELEQVVAALDLGRPLDDALAALADRLPSREVVVLTTTLVVQHRAGGRLVTALRALAATLEERAEVRREVRTQLAGAVASSSVVAGLGVGSLLLLDLLRPGVLEGLVASGPGRLVVVASAGLYALGFTLIAKLTRIDP